SLKKVSAGVTSKVLPPNCQRICFHAEGEPSNKPSGLTTSQSPPLPPRFTSVASLSPDEASQRCLSLFSPRATRKCPSGLKLRETIRPAYGRVRTVLPEATSKMSILVP